METFVLSWMLMLGALTGAGNFPVDMFETTSHQFGTVVRGAKTEYEFVFTNKYVEDVVVESVRSSCQCTTPTLLTPGPIKTHQQGRIKIHINTDQFTGNKNATITVRFAAPQHVEMQLHSYVYIRSDVSVNPGIVYFGSVDLAKTPNPGISVNVNSINYGWRILDVQSECKFLSVELKQLQAYQGTTYNMIVRLRPNAPPGPFSQVLELVTNDDVRSRRIPVRVEGRIKQTLSASPSPLSFNIVEKGKKVEKTLVIQGAEPFKILDITSEDRNITASIDHASKKVQPIKLTYTGKESGDFHGSITILTSLEGRMDTSVHFNGKVVEPVKPIEKTEAKNDEFAEENLDEVIGGETEKKASKAKESKNNSKKKETLSPEAEAEEEKASETALGSLDDPAPQENDVAVDETEKDEDSLALLDLPGKEDESTQKTKALPLNFDDAEETAETAETADEKAEEPTDVETAKPDELGAADSTDAESAMPDELEAGDSTDAESAMPDELEAGDSTDVEAPKPDELETEDPTDVETAKPAELETDEPTVEKADEPADAETDEPDELKTDEPAEEKADETTEEKTDEGSDLFSANIEQVPEESEKVDSASTPKIKKVGRNLLKKK